MTKTIEVPTASEQLLELAARCEAATGPDDDLDCEIAEATGAWKSWPTWRGFRPTVSLDAAMTLVPEGCGVLTTDISWEHWAQIVGDSELDDGTKIKGPAFGSAKAATTALALCAAALKAQAQGGR